MPFQRPARTAEDGFATEDTEDTERGSERDGTRSIVSPWAPWIFFLCVSLCVLCVLCGKSFLSERRAAGVRSTAITRNKRARYTIEYLKSERACGRSGWR